MSLKDKKMEENLKVKTCQKLTQMHASRVTRTGLLEHSAKHCGTNQKKNKAIICLKEIMVSLEESDLHSGQKKNFFFFE